MNKTKRTYHAAKWTAVMALSLIAATGCSNALNSEAPSSVQLAEHSSDTYPTGDSPQKTYSQGQDSGSYGKEPAASDANASGGDMSAESSGKNTSPSGTGTASKQQQWDASHPIMLGLRIGDSNTKVSERYGKANDVYSLKDDSETIEVHEYKGFAVGINEDKAIQYIEVYDKSIVTGLSGVRVEDKTETVLKALGKPTSQNSYIITYQGKDSLLKFDLDPDHNKIVSIKLLAGA
ncbi:hypothetical protein PghCCS26_63300 [Paenibacillus glycanilyticus]|uniref:DUF4309 domain-containing protein n=1 Tax=Paenibacillus glycanilyticus TaxID=126569 RepID=A0ABQ6NYJ4_9BACL|nr:hypothetical protein [Paenibacillus glycanilyticus]GMK49200.1 hypothetical protein PghCCS26_63300 [Paenibacillus glycanilyticus]